MSLTRINRKKMVFDALAEHKKPMTTKDLIQLLPDVPANSISVTLTALKDMGYINKIKNTNPFGCGSGSPALWSIVSYHKES